MELTDKLRRVGPGDQWIFDSSGNLVGARNPNMKGLDLRPPRYSTDSSGNVTGLVGPDGGDAGFPRIVSGALVDVDGNSYPLQRGVAILSGASAGADSGWIPMGAYGERFIYQLDSGSVSTGFTVDISADGVTSLGQAFTGTWASSSLAEITPPLYFSNPLAKFIRWSVTSGGPLTVARSA